MKTQNQEDLIKGIVDEYNSQQALLKYSTGTAGTGINYLLQHDYANVYLKAVNACLQTNSQRGPLNLLEFGCGAGMNLIHLLTLLEGKGIPVGRAVGTDLSVSLIERAKQEARAFLPPEYRGKASFYVARNERLVEDLASASGKPAAELHGSFDMIFGVNTFRYCHRLGKEDDCVKDIRSLLRPGGVCVMIDMNNRFKLFRSRLKKSDETPEAVYLPSLEEHAAPFKKAGFEIVTMDHFCWIPHSAGRALTFAGRLLTPVLDLVARSFAMRSLVVAKKPA